MNLVGKIFTVLILVMSLVFMTFAVSVYATHKNWRELIVDPVTGLAKQLEIEKKTNATLADEKAKLETDLRSELAARRQQIAKLETEKLDAQEQNKQKEKELEGHIKGERDAVAAMATTQETLATLRKEIEALREQTHGLTKEKTEAFNEVVALTDKLHQSVNELKLLKERNLALAADLAKANNVLLKFNLERGRTYEEVAPDVEAVVLAIQGSDLIEISVGSDSGLAKGHRLEVFRGKTYLGRVEVVQTEPERAVCRIDPSFRKGTIQKGDQLASRIK